MEQLANYGVLGVILAIFLGASWKILKWFQSNVAEPLIASHLGLISDLRTNMAKDNERLDAIFVLVNKQNDLLISFSEFHKTLSDRINCPMKETNHGQA